MFVFSYLCIINVVVCDERNKEMLSFIKNISNGKSEEIFRTIEFTTKNISIEDIFIIVDDSKEELSCLYKAFDLSSPLDQETGGYKKILCIYKIMRIIHHYFLTDNIKSNIFLDLFLSLPLDPGTKISSNYIDVYLVFYVLRSITSFNKYLEVYQLKEKMCLQISSVYKAFRNNEQEIVFHEKTAMNIFYIIKIFYYNFEDILLSFELQDGLSFSPIDELYETTGDHENKEMDTKCCFGIKEQQELLDNNNFKLFITPYHECKAKLVIRDNLYLNIDLIQRCYQEYNPLISRMLRNKAYAKHLLEMDILSSLNPNTNTENSFNVNNDFSYKKGTPDEIDEYEILINKENEYINCKYKIFYLLLRKIVIKYKNVCAVFILKILKMYGEITSKFVIVQFSNHKSHTVGDLVKDNSSVHFRVLKIEFSSYSGMTLREEDIFLFKKEENKALKIKYLDNLIKFYSKQNEQIKIENKIKNNTKNYKDLQEDLKVLLEMSIKMFHKKIFIKAENFVLRGYKGIDIDVLLRINNQKITNSIIDHHVSKFLETYKLLNLERDHCISLKKDYFEITSSRNKILRKELDFFDMEHKFFGFFHYDLYKSKTSFKEIYKMILEKLKKIEEKKREIYDILKAKNIKKDINWIINSIRVSNRSDFSSIITSRILDLLHILNERRGPMENKNVSVYLFFWEDSIYKMKDKKNSKKCIDFLKKIYYNFIYNMLQHDFNNLSLNLFLLSQLHECLLNNYNIPGI